MNINNNQVCIRHVGKGEGYGMFISKVNAVDLLVVLLIPEI